MKSFVFIFVVFLTANKVVAQSYFDEIVEKHKMFFYSVDSIQLSPEKMIAVSRDSLIIRDQNNKTTKRYWQVDSSGKIVSLFFEVSENKLFVIEQLDLENRRYLLYKQRGKRKIVLFEWIEIKQTIEKQRDILIRPKRDGIRYFKEGLFF